MAQRSQRPFDKLRVTWWDRVLLSVFPSYGQRRLEARARVRHYEAAQFGRRTESWRRTSSDANAANGPAIATLRELSRDLKRNNGWAKSGLSTITNNTVGWGIMPKAKGRSAARGRLAVELWNEWATDTACDFDGRLNFYGIQRLVMESIAESGEVLVVKQPPVEDLAIPMRLQVLEADYIDTNLSGTTADGNRIVQGIECNKLGKRVAYWLFTSHPGSQLLASATSERMPADRVLHIYRVDRPGQMRGVPWLASAIARLKDLDDFEDAELMQQKVAACFAAFVTDVNGDKPALGVPSTDANDIPIESLEPGQIQYLTPGQDVEFAQPPAPQNSAFSTRVLRRIAVSLDVTYEDLTGDYSQVNFSSARMARLAHWACVDVWREHMIIPQLCVAVWRWAMEIVKELERWPSIPGAEWASPPMPILEPDKEGLAYLRLVRIGAMTWPQMVRILGYDPNEQLAEIEEFNEELDKRGIVLDIDPRRVTAAGQAQASAPEETDEVDDEDVLDEAADDESDAARALVLIAKIERAEARASTWREQLRRTARAA